MSTTMKTITVLMASLVAVEGACDPNTWSDDASANYFTADCSGATAAGGTCVLTRTAGYENGSVTCGADDAYTAVPATAIITGMCTGNSDTLTDVDCSVEATNTVNKGSTASGTDAATCCEAPTITGMCTGNTDTLTDVDCSGEATNTVNKGSSASGTDAATCCEAPITGMCTGNTDTSTDVDCSGEATNTVNKGSTASGTDAATCCEAPITGMCTGNTDTSTDVDCSGEATNTVNKGSSASGTDAATCCEAPISPSPSPSPSPTSTCADCDAPVVIACGCNSTVMTCNTSAVPTSEYATHQQCYASAVNCSNMTGVDASNVCQTLQGILYPSGPTTSPASTVAVGMAGLLATMLF